MKEIIHFLRELRMHNNREWFNAHKDEYTRLRKTFETYINQLIVLIGEKDEELHGLEASACLYRIYRDIRFSPDKTPYKPISPHIWPGAGKIVRVPDITYI